MRGHYRRVFLCVISASVVVCAMAEHAIAAELVKINSPLCEMKIQGTIVPGDFKKFEAELDTKTSVCLNSPGGSYLDGLQLFEHFSANRIGTAVDNSDTCLSARAIAFMG